MNDTPRVKLAIFISGNGSNLKAIHQEMLNGFMPYASIELVVSSNQKAAGLNYAKNNSIETYIINQQDQGWDLPLLNHLETNKITDIALAGFMKVLPKRFIDHFIGRIYNIHPSLLPKYGGKGMYGQHVHEAVIKNKECKSGCTVHIVTAGIDEGPILAQSSLIIESNDTAASLAIKVLELEHQLYAPTLDAHFRKRIGKRL